LLGNHSSGYIQVQAKQMKIEKIPILVGVQELPDINFELLDVNQLKLSTKNMAKDSYHFWKLFGDMDVLLFF